MTGRRISAPRVPSGKVLLQAPPELQAADGTSILSSMLPMLGSVGSIVMVVMMSNSGGNGARGMLVGGMFLLSSVGFVVVNGWRQRSQRQAGTLVARREYLAYLADLRKNVRTAASQQRRAGNWRYPAPSALPYLAEDRGRAWERSAVDQDFLTVRIGTCDQALCLELEPPELPPLAQLDPVAASAAHRFMLTHETQHDLPLPVALRSFARIEITGGLEETRALARAMVLHAVTMHDPDDLYLVVAAGDSALPEWEWVKWLPHVQSRQSSDRIGATRMVGSDLGALLALLPAEVRDRPRFGRDEAASILPHILVVIDGARVPMGNSLFDRGGGQGMTMLELPATWRELDNPNALRLALETPAGGPPSAQLIAMDMAPRRFAPDAVSVVEAEATARRLLPLRPRVEAAGTTSTASSRQEELVDLLGLPDVRDIDYDVAWAHRGERDRLRVPIGQTTTGAPLVLDIKEAAQRGMGPHGLIIGATGSGKSEVLRTLVLALAMTHSPEQLNFVLVDFKGGATFAGMAEMPHVSAIITNLGQELALVDRMQDALHGEMVRRQEVLRAAGNFSSVSDYEKARRAGRTDLAPLPALLIVADEFSELLSAKPEFADTFVEIGRLGRSLQVHLLMSSQRLEEGKLRGLDSHLSYRIGLRVFSASESRAVLGVPDAVQLPSMPGVGFLKSNTDELTQFRAAYVSGAPPRRVAGTAARSNTAISATVEVFTAAPVVEAAAPISPEPAAGDGAAGDGAGGAGAAGGDAGAGAAGSNAAAADPAAKVGRHSDGAPAEDRRSTFEIAVERMSSRGPKAHRVWLPPLETPLTLDQLFGDLTVDPALGLISPKWQATGGFTIPLGLVDVPLEQRREALVVSLGGAGGHMAIVGGPLSGKSTLARTTVVALSLTHTPLEVQFYVLDFGGGAFAGLTGLPHLAGTASRTEPDAVRRTIAEITGILNAREVYFRQNGIDSIETYRRRRSAGQADDGYGDVFLVVDGWAVLRSEYEELEIQVQALAARGLTYGVHVMITVARWMELRAAIKDQIGTRIELRLGDPTDSEVGRKQAENVAALPGRGLSPAGLQMLTALPRVDGEPSGTTLAAGVDDLVKRTTAAWTGPAGPKLRMLPSRIALDAVRDIAGPDERKLLLGIDEVALAPYGIDVANDPHLYLYGDADSGKSSMLRAYIHEIMRLYPPKKARIFVVDYRRALLGEVPDDYVGAYLPSHDVATSGISDLARFFSSRMPGPDVSPEQLRNRSWWTGAEGFVLVDDYDLVATSQGNPITPLVPLLPQASDLGLHVVVTRRTGGASRAAYDPVLQRFTDLGVTGILLSGNPEEGQLIGRVKPAPAPPGRAQIVSRDRGLIRAQLAWVPPRYA